MPKTCYLSNYVSNNKYTQYAENVLSGQITACQYVKDVCARFLSWFDRTDIEFRAEKADKVINFVQNLEHFTG
jgi:phage terminase large subunit-like protein